MCSAHGAVHSRQCEYCVVRSAHSVACSAHGAAVFSGGWCVLQSS